MWGQQVAVQSRERGCSKQDLAKPIAAPADVGVDLEITYSPELGMQKLPGKAGKMQGPKM